jgi:hypothetical protein
MRHAGDRSLGSEAKEPTDREAQNVGDAEPRVIADDEIGALRREMLDAVESRSERGAHDGRDESSEAASESVRDDAGVRLLLAFAS